MDLDASMNVDVEKNGRMTRPVADLAVWNYLRTIYERERAYLAHWKQLGQGLGAQALAVSACGWIARAGPSSTTSSTATSAAILPRYLIFATLTSPRALAPASATRVSGIRHKMTRNCDG